MLSGGERRGKQQVRGREPEGKADTASRPWGLAHGLRGGFMYNLGTYLGLSIMSASGNDTLGQTIAGSSENGVLLSPFQASALSVNKQSPGRWSDLLR